jgi:hypothetical protein
MVEDRQFVGKAHGPEFLFFDDTPEPNFTREITS